MNYNTKGEFTSKRRSKHFFAFIAAVFLLLFTTYIWYFQPFLEKDPSKLGFSETHFRLRHYASYNGVKIMQEKLLPRYFPIGTNKEYVDLMLVKRGGAQVINQTDFCKGCFVYSFKPWNLMLTPNALDIRVYFDENDNVVAVWYHGKMPVGAGYKPILIPGGLKLGEK